jgi:hypothetical protein
MKDNQKRTLRLDIHRLCLISSFFAGESITALVTGVSTVAIMMDDTYMLEDADMDQLKYIFVICIT